VSKWKTPETISKWLMWYLSAVMVMAGVVLLMVAIEWIVGLFTGG